MIKELVLLPPFVLFRRETLSHALEEAEIFNGGKPLERTLHEGMHGDIPYFNPHTKHKIKLTVSDGKGELCISRRNKNVSVSPLRTADGKDVSGRKRIQLRLGPGETEQQMVGITRRIGSLRLLESVLIYAR